MRWYIKKQTENNESILINYSYEKNDTCDGLLKYDKISEKITIERISNGADEFATRWLFSHIYGLLGKKELTEKKHMIAIG